MPYSSVDKPSSYFDTKLYTGTGATQSISGLNFSPDLVWLKSRGEAQDHYLFDSIRTATKALSSNLTLDEQTYSDSLTSFNSDGFTLGASTRINKNTFNHVGWCWDANGAGSSNTSGSITSTVSANTTSGFSIVSYTANAQSTATVGHGLGVAPSMIIFKERSGTSDWMVYHKSLGAGNSIKLNSTSASASNTISFGNTSPTSSLFTIGENGGDYQTNYPNTATYIAYCFAEIKGYSKFGSYTGNGNADGTFVYTGFKPAWVLVKVTSTTDDWNLIDNKRDPYNEGSELVLYPNSSAADTAATRFDMLSNGFKMRTTNVSCNGSGSTYIYMAFAENPFVSSKGIPTCAR
jgi:hypothetical protein